MQQVEDKYRKYQELKSYSNYMGAIDAPYK